MVFDKQKPRKLSDKHCLFAAKALDGEERQIVIVALISLYLVLYKTRIEMIVRGIEDSTMVDALGINFYKVFMQVVGTRHGGWIRCRGRGQHQFGGRPPVMLKLCLPRSASRKFQTPAKPDPCNG